MAQIRGEIVIELPIDDVFDFVADERTAALGRRDERENWTRLKRLLEDPIDGLP